MATDPPASVVALGADVSPCPVRARLAHVLRPPRLRRRAGEDWLQLLRFALVGGSGYIINLAVFAALSYGLALHHLAAGFGAFCVALTTNFALNRCWTFRATGGSPMRQAVRYVFVSLVALSVNLVLLEVLVTGGAAELVAQAVAILCATPVNFLLNRRWSFG